MCTIIHKFIQLRTIYPLHFSSVFSPSMILRQWPVTSNPDLKGFRFRDWEAQSEKTQRPFFGQGFPSTWIITIPCYRVASDMQQLICFLFKPQQPGVLSHSSLFRSISRHVLTAQAAGPEAVPWEILDQRIMSTAGGLGVKWIPTQMVHFEPIRWKGIALAKL